MSPSLPPDVTDLAAGSSAGRQGRLRVDFVATELAVGGAERCLTAVAVGLKRRGHRIRVFSLGPLPKPPRDGLVAALQEARIPLVSVEASYVALAPLALNRLRRGLARDRADVVQSFLFHANVIGLAAASLAGVPTRIAGIRVAERRPRRLWLERQVVGRSQMAVCVSQAVADFAMQQLAVTPERLRVIPNAVDVTRFASAAPTPLSLHGIPADAEVLLFVGRLDDQKNLPRLAEVAKRVLPKHPHRHLVLVGDGPLRNKWLEWTADLPSDRIHLVGWQADVAGWMAAARLLLLTSDYEGMPNVILEAMAAGLPVVATPVEGVGELLGPEASGQQVSRDATQLAAAAVRWLDEPAAAQQQGRRNAQRAAEVFSLDVMIQRYEQLYRSLAAAAGSAPARSPGSR